MRREHWTILVLVVATLCVMGPLCGSEFTNWDDDTTIAHNPRLNPPSWGSVGYYWTHTQEGLYAPVTYTAWNALAAVGRLESPDPTGVRLNSWVFHTFNVLVHVVNVLLVFGVLRLILGGDDVAACIGALVFAVHPVQVEAVGWASGTKDLLCGMFSLLAVWQYLLYARRRGEWGSQDERLGGKRLSPGAHYAIGLIAMVLGILSKPTAMVVPAIVFVLDVCVVGRPVKRAAVAAAGWLLAAAPLMVVAKLVQPAELIATAPLWARPMVAGFSLFFYLGKVVWPARLAFDYGWRPPLLMAHGWFYVVWIVPVVVGVVVWRGRRRWPVLRAGALVFVIGLAPVLGFSRFLFQTFSTVADHYLYLSMLGVAMGVGWGVARFGRRVSGEGTTSDSRGRPSPRSSPGVAGEGERVRLRWGVLAAMAIAVVALAVRAAVQVPVWRDSLTLNANNVAVTPWSYASFNNLGNAYDDVATALVKEGRFDEALGAYARAVESYRESLRTDPAAPPTSRNLAMALVRLSGLDTDLRTRIPRMEEAARHLEMAAELPAHGKSVDPRLARDLYVRLAAHYEGVLRRRPDDAEAARRLAEVRGKLGEQTPVGGR
jgi:hypothetical protein